MTQEFYGEDLARYKLERAREEIDTAELLFQNERLKAAIMCILESFRKKSEEVFQKPRRSGMQAIMMNFMSQVKRKRKIKFRLRRRLQIL